MAGEFRELVAEVRQSFANWRARRRAEPDIVLSDLADSDLDQILFKPLDPSVANQLDDANTLASPGKDVREAVCPITRQTVDLERGCYVCRACGISYSREGWAFLRKENRGDCCQCGCHDSVSFRVRVGRWSDQR
jgi:hypothetical protein